MVLHSLHNMQVLMYRWTETMHDWPKTMQAKHDQKLLMTAPTGSWVIHAQKIMRIFFCSTAARKQTLNDLHVVFKNFNVQILISFERAFGAF